MEPSDAVRCRRKVLARGKLSVTPSKERCQTEHCHTNRVNLAFGKPPADTVCTGQYGARRGEGYRYVTARSGTEQYAAIPSKPRNSAHDRTGQYGTRRGGDIGTALHRAVLSITLTYYHSLRTPPTTKRPVPASTTRGEAGISVPHGTWRGGDAGTALYRAVLSSTLTYYQSLTWLSNSAHSQKSVRASTVRGDAG